jgi:hypothetical protein
LSLPRRGATPEEVLLQLRGPRSGYEVGFAVGIRYTFGSLFDNIVNPRFGNRGAAASISEAAARRRTTSGVYPLEEYQERVRFDAIFRPRHRSGRY